MDQRIEIRKAYLAAVVFSIVVGFSFLGVKTCVPLASTLQILVWRYNFAALVMFLLIITKVVKINIREKPKKNLLLTAGFYIGFMILQTAGLIFSTSIESGIIFAIIPIFTRIIASIVLKERGNLRDTFFMMLSISALVVMILMGSNVVKASALGLTILILSSLSMAISNVYMRYVRQEYMPFEISATICFMGCFVFNGAYILSGGLPHYMDPVSHHEFLIATFYLGTACIVLSAHLMAYMLQRMPAVNATIFGNLSTAISITAGIIILREPLYFYHIVCTLLIVAGVLGLSLPELRKASGKIK
ncbi:MAG: DMT family transporter [Anaerovoracaceae bacterium]|nr:DMT family transporter [Clostridiales bacterium]